MDRARYLEHEGKQIFVTDLSGLTGEELVPVMAAAAKVIRSHPPDSLLTLTIATTTRFNLRTEDGEYDRVAAESIRNIVKGNRASVKASAIVLGNDEGKRVIVEFFNRVSERHFEAFDSIEEALDWLATR